jgi:putative ABC transport system ATP-binding protein
LFHSLNASGVTIVLVTHEPDVARHARRVVVLQDGQIVQDGSVSHSTRPDLR